MTELDPGARELIDLARQEDGPTSTERSRVRAALLGRVGAAVIVASTGTAAASSTAGAASAASTTAVGALVAAAAKVVVGAVIIGAVGTGGYLLVSSDAPERPNIAARTSLAATATAGTATERRAAPPAPPARPSSSERSSAVTSTPPPVAATGIVVHGGPLETPRSDAIAARPAPSSAADTLGAETRALADAMALLRDGRADRALQALAAQEVQYGGGVLGEERAAARIEALCTLGRSGEAGEAASLFLQQHPTSLQAARVRASCGTPSSTIR
jgi:hypothetical protein